MRLLTLRTPNGTTTAVRQDGGTLTEIPGFADVGALLQDPAW
ncbi:MAG TPA: FAA hydrolase family protein, partial [Arthrobacter sp.]